MDVPDSQLHTFVFTEQLYRTHHKKRYRHLFPGPGTLPISMHMSLPAKPSLNHWKESHWRIAALLPSDALITRCCA